MSDQLTLEQIKQDIASAKAALRQAGVPTKTISSISAKAMKTGRKVTGAHATNRDKRWEISVDHPQYGSEIDCHMTFVKLCAQIFCFDNAPECPRELRDRLVQVYNFPIQPNSFRDSLLLEHFDFNDLVREGLSPTHGHSSFHIGHEDPTLVPKHQPGNINWRTYRSNLIQGNMTLRESRIYFVKLIARYFELGEQDIH